MISNLASARALLQADLEHARNVLELWSHQVEELEKALAQLDAVVHSRDALRGKYQALAHAPEAGAPSLAAPAKRGRKPRDGTKDKTAGSAKRTRKQSDATAKDSGGNQDKTAGRPVKAALPAKYRDPESGKTWSGRGRVPAWLAGDRERYAI